MNNTITKLTSPHGFRARFEFLARAGELSIIGEPIPEVAVETSRRGYGAATRERAQRVIDRAVRMGWRVAAQTTDRSESPAAADMTEGGGLVCHFRPDDSASSRGKEWHLVPEEQSPWGRGSPALLEWTLYRCTGPSCPGLPFRPSDIAHPSFCALPE